MPYEVKTNGFHDEVVEWLQENVGDLLWSRPIVEWKGKGWTMNHFGSLINESNPGRYRYLIRINDAELATMCALRWS
jgi:hypothetical protein